MKILANDGISAAGQAALEADGHEVLTTFIEQGELADFIGKEGIDGLLVRSATQVRSDLIDACPALKFVIRGGVGMDNIDVDYARSKGVVVSNTPASSSQSVAELVMGHLFSLSRFLHDSNRKMPGEGPSQFKTLKKTYGKGTELRGKTLAVVGFGRIGRSLAGYALGCGMNVVAVDQKTGSTEVPLALGNGASASAQVNIVTLAEALPMADAISLHIPAQSDGRAVIDGAAIAQMKDGVLLVNAARGGVVDEDALLSALDAGKVRAAALDVFVGEPSPRADVCAHPRLALTPHTGAATLEAQDRIGLEIAEIVSQLNETATA